VITLTKLIDIDDALNVAEMKEVTE